MVAGDLSAFDIDVKKPSWERLAGSILLPPSLHATSKTRIGKQEAAMRHET